MEKQAVLVGLNLQNRFSWVEISLIHSIKYEK